MQYAIDSKTWHIDIVSHQHTILVKSSYRLKIEIKLGWIRINSALSISKFFRLMV